MNKAVVTLGVSCLGAITVALGVIGALGVSTVALSASRGPATADTATPDSVMPPTGSGWQVPEATPADLVPIGQGGHRLRPVAAAGFAAWQAAYGRTIWITDSWRSATQQADCVRRKPTWCAPPSQSWHVKGLAVDVWL